MLAAKKLTAFRRGKQVRTGAPSLRWGPCSRRPQRPHARGPLPHPRAPPSRTHTAPPQALSPSRHTATSPLPAQGNGPRKPTRTVKARLCTDRAIAKDAPNVHARKKKKKKWPRGPRPTWLRQQALGKKDGKWAPVAHGRVQAHCNRTGAQETTELRTERTSLGVRCKHASRHTSSDGTPSGQVAASPVPPRALAVLRTVAGTEGTGPYAYVEACSPHRQPPPRGARGRPPDSQARKTKKGPGAPGRKNVACCAYTHAESVSPPKQGPGSRLYPSFCGWWRYGSGGGTPVIVLRRHRAAPRRGAAERPRPPGALSHPPGPKHASPGCEEDRSARPIDSHGPSAGAAAVDAVRLFRSGMRGCR